MKCKILHTAQNGEQYIVQHMKPYALLGYIMTWSQPNELDDFCEADDEDKVLQRWVKDATRWWPGTTTVLVPVNSVVLEV